MILEKAECPACGKDDDVIPIIYSCTHADYERYRELEKQGKCIMAGCVLSVDTPKFFCKRCNTNIWLSDLKR